MSVSLPEKIDGETEKAYEAFLEYLVLPSPSLIMTYRKVTGRPHDRKVHNSSFYRWSRCFRWKVRRRNYVKARFAEVLDRRFESYELELHNKVYLPSGN